MSVPQHYPEPPEPLHAVRLGDDTVIVLDADEALVRSASEPDVWHVVSAGTCTCKGYLYRQVCKHLRRVEDVRLLPQELR